MGGLEEEAEMGREQVSMAPSLQQLLLEAVGNPSSELAPCCVPACRCGLSLLQPHVNQNPHESEPNMNQNPDPRWSSAALRAGCMAGDESKGK